MLIATAARPPKMRTWLVATTGIKALALATMIAGAAYTQERGTIGYTSSELLAMCDVRAENGLPFAEPNHFFSARNIAASIPHSSGLWVDGEFIGLPNAPAEEVLSQSPRQIWLQFRVARLIHGQASDVIDVRLNSDMLVFQGEGVSRYAKRQHVIDARFEELGPILDSIESLRVRLDEGEIDDATFASERKRLQALLSEKSRRHLDVFISSRLIVEAESFYDYGGAINERTSYLMQVQSVAGHQGAYYLRRVLNLDTNIFWGERRADILDALDGRDGFSPPTPFGAYDPNSDEDCQLLRESVPLRNS